MVIIVNIGLQQLVNVNGDGLIVLQSIGDVFKIQTEYEMNNPKKTTDTKQETKYNSSYTASHVLLLLLVLIAFQ